MKTIRKSITIEAPREVIWAAIINERKFRLWTDDFAPGTYFAGGWQKGESIQFLMKDEQGQIHGMQAEIAESDHLRRISIHQLGLVNGDQVDFDSDVAKKWVPAYEIYELEPVSPRSTRFSVIVDTNEEYLEELSGAWDNALLKLKAVCEQNLAPFTAITVSTDVQASLDHVWRCWTSPDYIKKWNHASDDWHCPAAGNDLRVGGRFVYTMAARDGSVEFDYAGTYTEVISGERITSQLDDGRMVWVTFEESGPDRTRVVEIFEAEHENTFDLQRRGWQAILDNFKREAESDRDN